MLRSELAALIVTLGLQKAAQRERDWKALAAPLRAAAAAAARKPGKSKSATRRGEGGTREGHDCFCPKRGEEREEMENSFSGFQQLEAPQRRKLGLQKSVGQGGGEKYLKSVGWVG